MPTEYKVVPRALHWTVAEKSRRIEEDLNRLAPDGWELATIDAVTFLGFDVGYCLVVKRDAPTGYGAERGDERQSTISP